MEKYKHNLQFLRCILKLVFPHYNDIFLLYMVKHFCKTEKLKTPFHVVPTSAETIQNKILQGFRVCDLNNLVIVNEELIESSFGFILIKNHNETISRKVYIKKSQSVNKGTALMTHNLFFNLRNPNQCWLKECHETEFKFADEVDLSLINTYHDWSHHIIDEVLKKYFLIPKFVHPRDVIQIPLKEYCREIFYVSNKVTNVNQNMYFVCNNVLFQEKYVNSGYSCLYNKTTLKQSANVQNFIHAEFSIENDIDLPMCPFALEDYFTELKNSVHPFIASKSDLKMKPTFLLLGRKGTGKHLLIECLASYFGMHLYTVNNFDILANVYAQNETKLKNIFFNAKLSAPCILEIKNFENFGKNNEGEYDERLINHFISELTNLLKNNTFPVILFCSSNEKHLPVQLKRVFLKTFEIKAPNEDNRESMLKWILEKQNIQTNCNLKDFTNKMHGYVFEDFKALVHYAVTQKDSHSSLLEESDFLEALSFMQANYNQSLGAPKVPKVLWTDVGGLDHVKQEIIKTIKLPLKHPEILKSTGLKRSGILLFGPPGTGKTLIAKAAATECGLCFLSIKGPELLNMYVGQSEQNIREVFEKAREASPCIIFFDELDSLAPNRGASGDSGGVMDRVVSQLLAEMDGLNDSGTIFIIGATNRPDLIDSALLRPGRFDKLLYIGPCTGKTSKIAVLKALTKKFRLSDSKILDSIVDMCSENLSGADFYGLCSNAWLFAARRLINSIEDGSIHGEARLEDVIVSMEDFQLAIKDVKPSITKADLDYFNKLKSELS